MSIGVELDFIAPWKGSQTCQDLLIVINNLCTDRVDLREQVEGSNGRWMEKILLQLLDDIHWMNT